MLPLTGVAILPVPHPPAVEVGVVAGTLFGAVVAARLVAGSVDVASEVVFGAVATVFFFVTGVAATGLFAFGAAPPGADEDGAEPSTVGAAEPPPPL